MPKKFHIQTVVKPVLQIIFLGNYFEQQEENI